MNTPSPFRFDQRNLDLSDIQSPRFGGVRVGQWRVQNSRGRTNNHTKGQVVILPGRGDFLEKYTPLALHLNASGYNVTSLEWPGQGASKRLGRHPQAGHIASYDDYANVLRQCLTETGLEAQKVTWFAYSMGAPVAMQALLEQPYHVSKVSKLVLLSPAFGFTELPEGLIRALSSTANALGFSRRFALGETPTDPATWTLENSQVSSDATAFEAFKAFLVAHPDYLLGGSTWGWVKASLEAFRRVRRADLAKLDVPVLLLSAQDELTVSVKAQREIAQRLPKATFVTLPGKHDLLLNPQEVVRDLFGRVERFLEV